MTASGVPLWSLTCDTPFGLALPPVQAGALRGRGRPASYLLDLGFLLSDELIDLFHQLVREFLLILSQMRRVVAPLARNLATRLAAKRRRHRAGQIDLRKTLRRSMSTGGVPIDLVLRKPRPARPERTPSPRR